MLHSYVAKRRLAEWITLAEPKALSLTALKTAPPTPALAGRSVKRSCAHLPMILRESRTPLMVRAWRGRDAQRGTLRKRARRVAVAALTQTLLRRVVPAPGKR